jgi:hypothetical protein
MTLIRCESVISLTLIVGREWASDVIAEMTACPNTRDGRQSYHLPPEKIRIRVTQTTLENVRRITLGIKQIIGFWPHSFTMCLGYLPWGFPAKNTLRGETHCTNFPNFRINVIVCGAGFRPGRRGPFVSAKGPKTIDAPSGLIRGDGRQLGKGGPTRSAQTRPASRQASTTEDTISASLIKERRSPIKDPPILHNQKA